MQNRLAALSVHLDTSSPNMVAQCANTMILWSDIAPFPCADIDPSTADPFDQVPQAPPDRWVSSAGLDFKESGAVWWFCFAMVRPLSLPDLGAPHMSQRRFPLLFCAFLGVDSVDSMDSIILTLSKFSHVRVIGP
jgi:hypothetical protein